MRLAAITALVVGLGAGSAAAQEPDIADGEAAFRKCGACHQTGTFARNVIGPVLNDVIGRRAASYPGYRYSYAMVAAGKSGLVWTAETLDAYLAKPRDFLPGTSMAFIGVSKPDERANIIAYMMTLSNRPASGE